jgi:hypothetical protein
MQKRIKLAVAFLFVLCYLVSANQEGVIFSDGFEEGINNWRQYDRVGKLEYIVDNQINKSGNAAVKITSKSADYRGWLTVDLHIKPGINYIISVWCKAEDIRGSAWPRVKIMDKNGKQLPMPGNPFCKNTYGDLNFPGINGLKNWQKIEGWFLAPEGAAKMVLELVLGGSGIIWWDNVEVIQSDTLPMNQSIDGLAIELMNPKEGVEIAVNPSSFVWSRLEGVAEYSIEFSQEKDLKNSIKQTVNDASIFIPSWLFTPGVWYWRVQTTLSGGISLSSPISSFEVKEDLHQFIMPTLSELRGRIPSTHPRLFFLREDLPQLRGTTQGDHKLSWQRLERILEQNKGKEVLPDPAPYANGIWNAEDWRRIWADARVARDTMINYAFGYLITGEPDYLLEAKKWMIGVAGWNPAGSTSDQSNDEASRAILEGFGFAFDWLYEELTVQERAIVLESIVIRGAEIYDLINNRIKMEINPYDSHGWNKAGILAQTAVAIFGEAPLAEKWLNYCLSLLMGKWPAWGGSDGGWAEGVFYHSPYINRFIRPAQALEKATGIDLLKHLWFDNGAYFQLYSWLPGSSGIEFGDGWPSNAVDGTAISNMQKLAQKKQNSYLQWYVNAAGGLNPGVEVPESFLRQGEVVAKPPIDLPQAHAFFDVGFAIMHRDMCNSLENAVFAFKSGPYGGMSHSHADQNSFNISAFGERLAIDSGYYDYYGSPHHYGWTRQTKAHNLILVNGDGQAERKAGTGNILGFLTSKYYDYVSGEAGAAYEGRLDTFSRQIVYLRPDFYIIADELEGPNRASYDWLLHALNEMEVDAEQNAVKITQGKAALDVRFLEPSSLSFRQTDEFPASPDRILPNQWHLTATAIAPDTKQRFLVIMNPQKVGEKSDYSVENLSKNNALGLKLEQGNTINYLGFNYAAELELAGIRTDGKAFAVSIKLDAPASFFIEKGKLLHSNDQLLYKSTSVSSASLGYSSFGIDGQITTSEQCELSMYSPEQPKNVAVDNKSISFSYDPSKKLITFTLPEGKHELVIQINDTPLKNIEEDYSCNIEWSDGEGSSSLKIFQGLHRGSGQAQYQGRPGRYSVSIKIRHNDPNAQIVLIVGEQRLKYSAIDQGSGCFKIGEINYFSGDKITINTYGQIKLDWLGFEWINQVAIGFEEGLLGWDRVDRIGKMSYAADETIKHSGNYAAKIESVDPVARGWIARNWNLEGGKDYLVTVWCRTENASKGAFPRIKLFDANKNQVMVDSPYCKNPWGDMNFQSIKGSNGWQKIECPFTAPPATASMLLDLILEGTGTVWWDDIVIDLNQTD